MSLVKTRLQDIRVKYPSQYDRDELRRTMNGLLDAAIRQTNSAAGILSPDLIDQAEKSIGRNMDIPVMKKGIVTISNVRSCDIAAGQSESDLVRVVFVTLASNIVMPRALYDTNQIRYDFDFNKKLQDIVEAWKTEMEETIDTALNSAKTQVYGSTIPTTEFTIAGGAIQVPVAKQDFFFNYVNAINFADDFNNPAVQVISSHELMPIVNKYINQGEGNAVNTSFQFAGKDFTFSNRVSVGVGKKATGYFMPEGSIGILSRTDLDARNNSKSTSGTIWAEDMIPGFPFPVGVQYKSECDDLSALEAGLGHLTASLLEKWQFSIDYAILMPYNSDPLTRAGAIRKFELVP